MTVTGEEYETAGGAPINGSNGTRCPTTSDVPSVHARCWTWRASGLGQGTYTQSGPPITGTDVAWNFVLQDSTDGTINGKGEGRFLISATPAHSIGHTNRIPSTLTLVGSTGGLAGIGGTLKGDFVTTVVGVDPVTGIVRKRVGPNTFTGPVTFDDD